LQILVKKKIKSYRPIVVAYLLINVKEFAIFKDIKKDICLRYRTVKRLYGHKNRKNEYFRGYEYA